MKLKIKWANFNISYFEVSTLSINNGEISYKISGCDDYPLQIYHLDKHNIKEVELDGEVIVQL